MTKGGFLPPFFLFIACQMILSVQAADGSAGNVTSQAITANPDYKIGTGDLVRIQVHDEQDLTLETRIDAKGTVTYPFLGELKVAGLTVRELEFLITNGLKQGYLVKPQVQVLIREYRPFYVNGQVKRPGGYPYLPDMTVQKAITLAGGMTELASKNKIYLIREKDATGKQEKAGLDALVMPGDTVIVEEGLF